MRKTKSNVSIGRTLWFKQPIFLRAQSGAQIKLRARKIGRLGINLSNPVTRCTTRSHTLYHSWSLVIPLSSKLWNLIQNEYKTIESLAHFKAKKEILDPRELSSQVMQRIYSPDRFNLSSTA